MKGPSPARLGWLCSLLLASALLGASPVPAQPAPFGSGSFGRWMDDPSGLPAYHYTCEQDRDPRARSRVNPYLRRPTEHTHQVGNDRLVAAASNYGVVEVRQDEGGPRILNKVDPDRHQYGGGFGYLTDGTRTLSTLYTGDGSFQRFFAVGYLRKWVYEAPYVVDQVILAPFGDDPVLVSQVTVQNRGPSPARLRWVEYWGAQHYPLSWEPVARALLRRRIEGIHEDRRRQAAGFRQTFRRVADWGLVDSKHPVEGTAEPSAAAPTPSRVATPAGNDREPTPPSVFLVSLDAPATGFSTDARKFFGQGKATSPDGLKAPLDNSLTAPPGAGALLLERSFQLMPGESRTLYFAFGYLPPGFDLEALLAKYQNTPDMHWAQSNTAWRYVGVQMDVAGEPWVKRELIWHNYYLRSNLTVDTFFDESILSQGHVYQWLMGFQGAARDPLQHALPLVYSDPDTVKGILRYTLKELDETGGLPYGITGHGRVMSSPFQPSDQQLWLLWLASEYVLANRDLGFLQQPVAAYLTSGPSSPGRPVGELLELAFRHLVDEMGVGEHGLLALRTGDWNDGVLSHLGDEERAQVAATGESVLNAAMASYVFDLYAELLTYAGQGDLARQVRVYAVGQRRAVSRQWTGRWFRRAWLTPELGWLGEERLWLEPQPWAILAGAASPEQTTRLVASIDTLLRQPSPIGAPLLSPPMETAYDFLPEPGAGRGVLTNGGVWPSINGTLVWALARVDGAMAWEEWRKNTLAYHARAYPDVWYGIWSGPDCYNSHLARNPGETLSVEPQTTPEGDAVFPFVNWTDFPVMNMHAHAWPLYSAIKLLGLELDAQGLTLRPTLPVEAYSLSSPLLGLQRNEAGFQGWYRPSAAGEWRIRFVLPKGMNPPNRVLINKVAVPTLQSEEGVIELRGEGSAQSPLRFEIPTPRP